MASQLSPGFGQTYDLIHVVDDGTTLGIKTQLQYTGSVIVDNAGQEENVRVLPMDVRARLDFDQRISSGATNTPQAIRYFDKAVATIKAGKGQTGTELNDSKRLILARLKQAQNGTHQFQIASIGDVLSQKEYELLKNPGDPLALAGIFNKTKISIGDKWPVEKEHLADLLAVNRIISSSVSMALKSVEGSAAKVYIYGEAKAEVDDAITEMNIKAIAMLDLNKKLVTSLRMTIDEDRRAGHVAPGFEGKFKIDTQLAQVAENPKLEKERLAKLVQGGPIKFAFLLDRDTCDFVLQHDSRWRVIASEEEAVVMRYMDDGQLIAQCNLVELPKRPADKPLTLSQFQDEIKKITTESQARIVHSNSSTTGTGLEALHVAVEGMESGIPFSWLYYHIAAADGRRVTFVFTLEKEVAEEFSTADRTLVNSLTFKAPKKESAAQASSARTTTPRSQPR